MKINKRKSGQDEEVRYKSGELKEIVYAGLGIALILGGSIVLTPNFPIIIGTLIKIIRDLRKEKIPEEKIRRTLRRLERRKIISIEKTKGEIEVKLLDRGRTFALKYSIKKLLDLKNRKKEWNGKWFLVAFDVPEQARVMRNYLRGFLKDIGFFQYQQSVYVYPYECEEEIKLIKKIVEGGKYISYIVAEQLENEAQLKTRFNLT